MEWLCWLFGALVLVTLLGHGIWVLLALMFRPRPRRATRLNRPLVDEWAITASRLRDLRDAGLIVPQTYDQVMAALNQARQRTTPPPLPVLPLPAEVEIQPSPVAPVTEIAPIPAALPEFLHSEPIAKPPRPPAVAIVKTPRRSPAEVFAAFLHDSNIRWGELMGGLLIVGCSIALVLSFWNQIAAKPLFQFGIFTTVIASAFALGLYAEHRWKLPTTSRGILLIATLLVPLNFLACAALSRGRPASSLIAACEVGALGLFGFLVWRAACVLSPYWPKAQALGVLGLSASLLATNHFGPSHSTSMLINLGALPLATYLAAVFPMLLRASRWKQVRAHAADAMFLTLGVLTFCLLLAMGLVIGASAQPLNAAHRLAPLLSLAVAPALVTGLMLWQRITNPRLGRPRTAGTAIAVIAAFLMLGAVALAWPDPAGVLPLAIIDFLIFAASAIAFDIPAAHILAIPCLGLAYAMGFQLTFGHIGWTAGSAEMLRALLTPGVGAAFMPLVAGISALSIFFARRSRPKDSVIHAWSAVALAAISLALVSQDGLIASSHQHGQWIYLGYGGFAMVVAWWTKRRAAGWAGCLLVLGSTLQFCLHAGIGNPWPTGMLVYATVAVLGAATLRRYAIHDASLARPARWTAMMASAVAAGMLLMTLSIDTSAATSLRVFWIAALWFLLAILEDAPVIFTLGQIALATATVLAIVGRLAHSEWFRQSPHPLLDAGTAHAVSIGLGALALALSLGRLMLPARLTTARWLKLTGAFDRVLAVALLVSLAAMSVAGVWPSVE